MCEETELFMELLSEASHPRVAGIVQTHRQHIDTQHGQQGVKTVDIEPFGKYQGLVPLSSNKPQTPGSTRF
jgi:hypothetical protein